MVSLTLSGLGSLHFSAEGLMVEMESIQDCEEQTRGIEEKGGLLVQTFTQCLSRSCSVSEIAKKYSNKP